MAALLHRDDLRRLAVPVCVFTEFGGRPPRQPLRPVASWQVDAAGRLICVWSMREAAPGGAPS